MNNLNKKNQNKNSTFYFLFSIFSKKGFTLIELLVAVTIFIAVIAIASGIFASSLKTQRTIVALMAANDNASLTIEQLSREIRTGSKFTTNNQGTNLSFTNIQGQSVTYEANNGAILRNGQTITASNVRVAYLLFALQGEIPDDGRSTRVTINLGVGATGKNLQNFVTNLQTTVSVRLLDA